MDSVIVSTSWLIQGAVVILVSVVWYLLKQKDDSQAKQIELLWAKHDEDATALQNLRLQIAGKHYERSELDSKFDKLDASVVSGFANMSTQFKILSDTLIAHINREDGCRRGDA